MYNFLLNTVKNTINVEFGYPANSIKLKVKIDPRKSQRINDLISNIETSLPIKFRFYTWRKTHRYKAKISYNNLEYKFICEIYSNENYGLL